MIQDPAEAMAGNDGRPCRRQSKLPVLIIVDTCAPRITSIKVAGAEIGLTDEERKKVADTLTVKVPEDAKRGEAAKAAVSVMAARTEEKAAGAPLTASESRRWSSITPRTCRGPTARCEDEYCVRLHSSFLNDPFPVSPFRRAMLRSRSGGAWLASVP
jgi:hypothetical protein